MKRSTARPSVENRESRTAVRCWLVAGLALFLAACSSYRAKIGHEVAGRSHGVRWAPDIAIWANSDVATDVRARYEWAAYRGNVVIDRGKGDAALPLSLPLPATNGLDRIDLTTVFLDETGAETKRLQASSSR